MANRWEVDYTEGDDTLVMRHVGRTPGKATPVPCYEHFAVMLDADGRIACVAVGEWSSVDVVDVQLAVGKMPPSEELVVIEAALMMCVVRKVEAT